jgi:hypothetical protein
MLDTIQNKDFSFAVQTGLIVGKREFLGVIGKIDNALAIYARWPAKNEQSIAIGDLLSDFAKGILGYSVDLPQALNAFRLCMNAF